MIGRLEGTFRKDSGIEDEEGSRILVDIKAVADASSGERVITP